VGLENYARVFEDPRLGAALTFTLLLIVVRVLAVTLVPLLLAFAINEFGRRVRISVRLLFTVPLALFAPMATTLAWALFLRSRNLHWLADPDTARGALLLIDGLITVGLACGVGLIYYLAALRGPGEEEPFWKDVLPPLIVSWAAGLCATIALGLESFTSSYVLTQGGPMGTTTTLTIYLFDMAFKYFHFGAGSAVATLVLIVVMALGLMAGIIVVLTRLRLEMVPWEKQSGLLNRADGPSWGRTVAVVLLIVALLGALTICLVSTLPILRNVANSLKPEVYSGMGDELPLSFGRMLVNTIVPPLVVLLLQVPIVYLGALGIGAARPLGKHSELLLLFFAPWLFVTVAPLSIVAFQARAEADTLGTIGGLVSPIILSVPMLFILTLFFKGQEPRWRAVQAEGSPPVNAFFTQLILPSLPLLVLLASLSFLTNMHDLFWPLVTGMNRESYNANMVLLMLRGLYASPLSLLTGLITILGVPAFLFFFVIFGLVQALYLDRLALTRPQAADAPGEGQVNYEE
jgi:ABC-type sugar transport system permease subunit